MRKKEKEIIDWQSLSKKERRQLKREQKRLRREREARGKRLTKWAFILGMVVFLVGGFFLVKYLKAKRYENAPKIQIRPQTHNFSKISASKGVVKTSFEVKNIGVSPLVISEMETSCECTTAILKNNGQESPVFGMHDNPSDWSASLEPDETAELEVVFDPNFHKDTFGPVTRIVSIFSNDPEKKEEKVTVFANVER